MSRLKLSLGADEKAEKEIKTSHEKALNAIGALGLAEDQNAAVVDIIRNSFATHMKALRSEAIGEVAVTAVEIKPRKKLEEAAESFDKTADTAASTEVKKTKKGAKAIDDLT